MFFRSSRPEAVCKKAVLRDFIKFTGKYLHQNLFINKVAGQGQQHCLKRDPGTSVSCEFCEIWKNTLEHQNRCSYKFPDIHQKIPVLMSLFDTVRGLKAHNFNKKDTSIQVFSCEYHKTFKNSCFIEQLWGCFLIWLKNF